MLDQYRDPQVEAAAAQIALGLKPLSGNGVDNEVSDCK